MDKEIILTALEKLKKESKKRNFKQSIDLIITLKALDLKKPENHLDFFITLHHDRGEKSKICAFVPRELEAKAKDCFDMIIKEEDFGKIAADKKLIKKIANQHEFFVAIATIMPKVAASFGKVLGPRGKMPNPKFGCVLPPTADLKSLYQKLQTTLRVVIKSNLHFQCKVGKEDDDFETVSDNILTVYNGLVSHLPNEKQNIKSIYIKLTMGHPIQILEKA